MKIRLDFVTNSSSSSYICDVCGNVESGFDAGPEELGMCECERGHVFCEQEENDVSLEELKDYVIRSYDGLTEDQTDRIKSMEWKSDILEYLREEDIAYEIPDIFCPICTFKDVARDDLNMYKNILLGKTDKELEKEILGKFKSYEGFKSFLQKIFPLDFSS